MTPFGDAVGFVDGDAGQLALAVDGGEEFAEVLGGAEFRGDVDEAGVGVAAF